MIISLLKWHQIKYYIKLLSKKFNHMTILRKFIKIYSVNTLNKLALVLIINN